MPQQNPTPTIYDVARAAGVSLATVSRVIQNRTNVRPDTRERVTAAVRKLGYQPNLLAAALMTRQTRTIGLLVSDIANPFSAEICRGVEDAGGEAGFSLMICNTDEQPEKEQRYISVLRQKGADGIIFASAEVGDESIVGLHRDGYPVVLLTRGFEGLDVSSVAVDDFQGGYMAARHLLALGHRRIALLSGPLGTLPALARKKGIEAALEQAGLAAGPDHVDSGPFTIEAGMAMGERLLERTGSLPSAIVAGNDLIAIGAIKALRRHGVRVPMQVSVVGYDGTALAEAMDPPLTTVAQPVREMGRSAMQLLLAALARGAEPRQVILPPRLVLGGSTVPWQEG